MADNKLTDFDDFELPPLPKVPLKKTGTEADPEAAAPTPKPAPAPIPKPAAPVQKPSAIADDFDLPPIPEAVKAARKAELEESIPAPAPKAEPVPEKAPEPEKKPELDDSYVFDDSDQIDYDNIDEETLKQLQKNMAPISTKKEAQARNRRELQKMDDLSSEVGSMPVLDDLSDEYRAPEKKADDLLSRDHLEADEKQILKQRLEEDLSRRPENFNARASKRMYNKLMEEKKLKIAKKGFGLVLLVMFMGLAAAGICYLKMNWPDHEWFEYVAYFGVAGSLMLLVKSNHIKLFSVIISAMTLIMYVGPGLFLYSLEMQGAPDYIVHILCGVAASVLNIVSIIMLTKNEAIKTYYTTEFKRQ